MDSNIIISILLGVISGVISSFITWLILNIIVVPRIKVDDEIQYGKRKNYIRIYNKSLLDVYEVVCYIEYKLANDTSFYRMDNPLPNLKKKTGKYVVSLGRNMCEAKNKKGVSKTDSFFSQDKGTIIITVTYQTRFGIKHTINPIKIKYIKEPSESTDFVK